MNRDGLRLFYGASSNLSLSWYNLSNWARFVRESLLVELLLAVRIVTLVTKGTCLSFLVELAHDCLVFVRIRCCQLVSNRLL